MTRPSAVAVVANLNKVNAREVARRLIDRLRGHGVEVWPRPDLAKALGETSTAGHPSLDLTVCLGGDGTLLEAVRSAHDPATPILGINLGGLGFLTAVPVDEADACVDRIVAGDFRVEERPMLQARSTDAEGRALEVHALNEIVVDEGTFTRRAVVLKMNIDGAYVGTFTADGLIVSTATGSTAYSLSAGGPIVHPKLPVLVATPVCAHSLSIRPLVFGHEEQVEVENLLPGVSLKVTADGQDARRVAPGSSITIGLSPRRARLAFVDARPYYEILRTKLNWGGIPKNR